MLLSGVQAGCAAEGSLARSGRSLGCKDIFGKPNIDLKPGAHGTGLDSAQKKTSSQTYIGKHLIMAI